MAYRLLLPSDAKIHLVFHVSQLKRVIGAHITNQPLTLYLSTKGEQQVQPQEVLVVHEIPPDPLEVLIQWEGLSIAKSSWEAYDSILTAFSFFHLILEGALIDLS